jgi:pimeloyl-ACP methyl ester carboxylesterase
MLSSAARDRIEAMWVIHITLGPTALYAAIIAAMYFAQTWLLFPSALARAARAQLPTSTQRLEVRTPDGEILAGIRISSMEGRAEDAPTLLGFGGNAWNAEATVLTLHRLFPHRDVVAFHYRGYAPSTGRPSAKVLFSDSLLIFDCLQKARASECIVAVGFSIGCGVAAYLARQRPVAGLILVTPFDSLEALARDACWWAPVGLLLRHRMPTIDFVRGSLAPTALITAERDAIVPTRRSAPVRLAIGNLVFERTIDAGHNDLYDHPAFAVAMREALARIEAASVEALGR